MAAQARSSTAPQVTAGETPHRPGQPVRLAGRRDPLAIPGGQLGVRGRVADVAQARFWYEKAVEFGSKEAPRRLQSLAQWR